MGAGRDPRELRLLLVGFGPVGRAFAALLAERRPALAARGRAPVLAGIVTRGGAWLPSPDALRDDPDAAAAIAASVAAGAAFDALRDVRRGFGAVDAVNAGVADVLLEATSPDLETGAPATEWMLGALEHGMDVVAASKGGLVAQGATLRDAAGRNGRRIRYGAATGAALPALDVLERGLAGADIERIEGILNGTSNAILTAMRRDGADFATALRDAQARGIAEADPRRDVDGWDTAAKLVLLAGAAWGSAPALAEVDRTGIGSVSPDEVAAAARDGGALRLVGTAWREGREAGNGAKDGEVRIRVAPEAVPATHPFAHVDGPEKAVTFETSTLGRITVTGGASSPRGAAAAMLRDVLNLA